MFKIHPEAADKAAHARDWYDDHSPKLADVFEAELEAALSQVAEAPERWPRHLHGTRGLKSPRITYQVVYRSRVGSHHRSGTYESAARLLEESFRILTSSA